MVNQRQGPGQAVFIDARGAGLAQSNRGATEPLIAERVNAGFDRKVSVHHRLLHMGLHSHRPVRVTMLITKAIARRFLKLQYIYIYVVF